MTNTLKWPLIIFLIGMAIRFAGVIIKIRHWPSADEVLTAGMLICIAAILFAAVKLMMLKKR